MTNSAATNSQMRPILSNDVWTGWIAQYREWVEPSTDGAIEGIFGTGIVELGMALGRHVGVQYGRATYANLYSLLAGLPGVTRKTTLQSRGRDIRQMAFEEGLIKSQRTIGSGEGLLEQFSREENEEGTNRVNLVPVPGQIVLLDEPEFCSLLKKARRPGTANITEILLSLYDGDDLSPRTRSKPMRVIAPFFSIVTATTSENLERTLLDVDIESGLMPRFCTFYCTPREPVAYPPPPDQEKLNILATELQAIVEHARDVSAKTQVISLSTAARKDWETIFRDVSVTTREERGLGAAIMARVPQQIMKIALIYAIQAGRAEVGSEDIVRATLVGTYLIETARLVPIMVQKSNAARIEAKIVQNLEEVRGKWLTANGIHRLVSGRYKADDLRRSLDAMDQLGVIESAHMTGRKTKVYRIAE